jgi:energy-coupling factor transport system ATP-binding protein
VSELAIRRGAAPALAIEGLAYRYPRSPSNALEAVSLAVAPGEFVLLAGRSASGKSTLLRAACGLVPHFHGGEIEGGVAVAGLDAVAAGPAELAAAVGYVAQDPETQVVSTTVAAEIELPLEMRGDAPSARARAVEEVALALAIPHLLGRTVDTLSGGELQRVALAAALVTRPSLILLDEPTSQLDPVAGDELIWLLRRLNEEWGVAVLLAEHRLERCLAAADRVVAMEAGAIAFDGPPAEFLTWAAAVDPALETPAARLFSLAGLDPLPTGVRQARQALAAAARPFRGSFRTQAVQREPRNGEVLGVRGLWVELAAADRPRDVLRGIDLTIRQGERVALMGRNGAGKSTLLKTAAGLIEPVRGKLEVTAGMALLSQNPGDYLVRERVGDELPGAAGAAALAAVGLEHAAGADPRDLSGGERQRLALEIVLQGEPPAVVCLDEPTRGMDRGHKRLLAERLKELAAGGVAVLVATHDAEFVAAWAARTVLLGDGRPVADAPTAEVLAGGWYFATQTARILGGEGGALLPEEGAAVLRAWMAEPVSA